MRIRSRREFFSMVRVDLPFDTGFGDRCTTEEHTIGERR